MADPKVKGSAFLSVRRSVAELRGEDAVEAALRAAVIEGNQPFRLEGIVATGWYPIDWYKAWLAGIRRGLGEGPAFLREVGGRCATNDLKGVYRVFMKMLAPETLYSLSPRFFSSFYDTGQLEILDSRPGRTHAQWTGCTGFDANMWAELTGSNEAFLEHAGAFHVRIRVIAGGGDGDDYMEAAAHWAQKTG
ncbi:MAG: hypothetical protein ACOCV4_09195 [Myxococcota bacterium]